MTITSPLIRRAVLAARRAHEEEEKERLDAATTPQAHDDYGDDLERQKHPLDVHDAEMQIPVASRDMSFWLTLIFAVIPIYLVTPLSWVYALYAARRLLLPPAGSGSTPMKAWEIILLCHCSFEVRFFRTVWPLNVACLFG